MRREKLAFLEEEKHPFSLFFREKDAESKWVVKKMLVCESVLINGRNLCVYIEEREGDWIVKIGVISSN